MKLKIQRKRFDSGMYYYLIYEWFWFHWVRRSGLFDTLEEAEKDAVRILEEEKERRKSKKEKPVYYKLDGDKITYKKGDIEIKDCLWVNHHSNGRRVND
jgi:hypothetical protein